MGVTHRVCEQVPPSNEGRRLDALDGWIGNRLECLASIVSLLVVLLERCRSSWGEPERGRADIGTQAGMHNTWMCGQMRLLPTCLALSRVPIVCT